MNILFFVGFVILMCLLTNSKAGVTETIENMANMKQTFLYFAYGSNLLAKRIHINNPSATRYDIGKLENYRLDFITFSKRWQGAVATIVPKENSTVWGAIWTMNQTDLRNLDIQESVHDNFYFGFYVTVHTPNGKTEFCRVYQQTITPKIFERIEELPLDRRPSPSYLKTILLGAKESKLAEDYINFLNRIPDNGYSGHLEINKEL